MALTLTLDARGIAPEDCADAMRAGDWDLAAGMIRLLALDSSEPSTASVEQQLAHAAKVIKTNDELVGRVLGDYNPSPMAMLNATGDVAGRAAWTGYFMSEETPPFITGPTFRTLLLGASPERQLEQVEYARQVVDERLERELHRARDLDLREADAFEQTPLGMAEAYGMAESDAPQLPPGDLADGAGPDLPGERS